MESAFESGPAGEYADPRALSKPNGCRIFCREGQRSDRRIISKREKTFQFEGGYKGGGVVEKRWDMGGVSQVG